jgi:hypothetical protein
MIETFEVDCSQLSSHRRLIQSFVLYRGGEPVRTPTLDQWWAFDIEFSGQILCRSLHSGHGDFWCDPLNLIDSRGTRLPFVASEGLFIDGQKASFTFGWTVRSLNPCAHCCTFSLRGNGQCMKMSFHTPPAKWRIGVLDVALYCLDHHSARWQD